VVAGFTSTAADLHLVGTGVEQQINGQATEVIDGSTTFKVDLDSSTTLNDLIGKLNGLGAGVTAARLTDGSTLNPFRFTLTSQRSGEAGNLLVDTSGATFRLEQTTRGRDAIVASGALDNTHAGVLAASANGRFDSLLSGASIQVREDSTKPVTVSVKGTDTNLVTAVQTFVDNYNKLRSKLAELTAFNQNDPTKSGVLRGENSALQIDTSLSSLMSGRFLGVGSVNTLEAIGVGIKDDGTLSFDSTEFKARYASNPDEVRKLFTDPDAGLATKLDKIIERLAGRGSSVLVSRAQTLGRKIESNNDRITFLNGRLETERTRLLTQFYRMELAIGKLQNNINALNSISPLPSLLAQQTGN